MVKSSKSSSKSSKSPLDQISTFVVENKKSIGIVIAVLFVLYIAVYFYRGKDEDYADTVLTDPAEAPTPVPTTSSTINVPKDKCKVYTLEDISEKIRTSTNEALKNADKNTIANFNSQLAKYSAAVKRYNDYPDCANACVGGVMNVTSGHCVCPKASPIPYAWKDPKDPNSKTNIYCIANDLSNITGAVFNPAVRQFSCGEGVYNVTGDNICYSSKNKDTLESAIAQLLAANQTIQKTPSQVAETYGQIGPFWTVGKASISSTVLSSLQKIGNVTGVTSSPQAAGYNIEIVDPNDRSKDKLVPIDGSIAKDATVFVYDPQLSSVDYYKGDVKATSLPAGDFTVGTKLLK